MISGNGIQQVFSPSVLHQSVGNSSHPVQTPQLIQQQTLNGGTYALQTTQAFHHAQTPQLIQQHPGNGGHAFQTSQALQHPNAHNPQLIQQHAVNGGHHAPQISQALQHQISHTPQLMQQQTENGGHQASQASLEFHHIQIPPPIQQQVSGETQHIDHGSQHTFSPTSNQHHFQAPLHRPRSLQRPSPLGAQRVQEGARGNGVGVVDSGLAMKVARKFAKFHEVQNTMMTKLIEIEKRQIGSASLGPTNLAEDQDDPENVSLPLMQLAQIKPVAAQKPQKRLATSVEKEKKKRADEKL